MVGGSDYRFQFVVDSLLEGAGFQPSVPHKIHDAFETAPFCVCGASGETDSFARGIGGSNLRPARKLAASGAA
jgi:hypothetical protein